MPRSLVNLELVTKKNIVLYHGPGGELAEDVAYALRKISISFNYINYRDIREDRFDYNSILIMHGR